MWTPGRVAIMVGERRHDRRIAIGERLECETKTVDNALQRVKRKVSLHIASRTVTV